MIYMDEFDIKENKDENRDQEQDPLPLKNININQYENLVFEGGGVKGIAFTGAVRSLEERDVMSGIKRIIGSSAGSMIASLLAIGYNANEMRDILMSTDLNKFKDSEYWVVGYVYRLLNYFGLYQGDAFYEWFGNLIKVKTGNRDTTFLDVFQKCGKELVITGTCVNKMKVIYFNHHQHPDMPVRLAVRLSMSLPFVFAAKKYKGDIYTDGGVLDNYPIWYFGDSKRTLGLKLVNPTERRDDQVYHDIIQINNIKDFGWGVINAMLDQIDRLHIHDEYWEKTITIDTLGYSALDFGLSKKAREQLVQSGYNSVNGFFTSPPKITKTSLLAQSNLNAHKHFNADDKFIGLESGSGSESESFAISYKDNKDDKKDKNDEEIDLTKE
jgi:NTE family protein